MFYFLLYPLYKYSFVFNVFRYVTFRSAGAFFTSFIFVFLFWKVTIRKLKTLKVIEKIDMYGHMHLEKIYSQKKGTPTMGGVLIIFSVVLSTLLWCRLDNSLVWYSIFCLLGMGVVGFIDDWRKMKGNKGLTRKEKLICQFIMGGVLGLFLVWDRNTPTTLDFPFLKNLVVDLGYFYIFWAILVITSTSNAVNFADGIDGLAIGGIITNFIVLALLSYLTGHIKFSQYLFIPYVKGASELTILCIAIVGAGLAFLWFNSHPAQIFMGDVGALALGALLGFIALTIKKEFLLVISGGMFVLEALSVVLQILSVKIRKKKIFRASPLHHHFQLLGWAESKIIVRFWIISVFFAVCALLTLKLR